ncbi:hypothetical protein [Streptomyces catenulae]|uniref:CarD-like/TRCF RNAP-interacting domain-containing protein n=1 Tax=Streptomyces catenulae TaxID=66875 RepID=A0ABV2Z6I4_9ACTN|nr:hypothetical protein [Streptomyces catenulae]
MGRRGTVSDYAGNELYRGDLITYGARQGNRVRLADAIIEKVTVRRVEGILRPMLLVQPTGTESGFVPRKRLRKEWISNEHARLCLSNVTGERDA